MSVNNYLAAARDLYKRLAGNFEKQTPQCFISRVDPDIILDDLIPYLDIKNILNLRKVNKFFYMITHEPIIWKRFLELRMNVDVPQIRPSLDYAAESSGFEIEALVVHAAQVATAWRCVDAINLNSHRCLESQLEVVDIKMVPGGNFVIASVRDRSNLRFYLMVFVLDTRSGSRALARFHIPHKAFDLQVQYLDRNGHQGIMISYTTRKFSGHPSNYINVSALSHKKATYAGDMTYEAVCLHLSLEILEQLLQSPFHVPSPEYEAFLRGLDRPFRVAAKYTAARSLEITCPSLSVIENTPVLLLVVGGSMVVIINLSDGQVGAQFECNCSQFFPLAPHRIRALRHLPGQTDLLVIRSISILPQSEESHLFERYSIPRHSDLHNRSPEAERELFELSPGDIITEFSISDPGSYMKQTSDSHPKVHFPEECPPTLWIFASLEAPSGGLCGLRYWRVRASRSELGQFRYDLPATKMYVNMSTHRARALPGSERVLVYNFESTVGDSEMLVRLRRFSPAAITFPRFPAPQPDMPAVTLLAEPYRAFREIESYQIKRRVNDNGGMSVITWDETTSRICISTESEDVIHVYDIPRHYEPHQKLAFRWRQQDIAERARQQQ